MSKTNDPVFLSYHDSLLRQSDMKLLEGRNWINDQIIGFYLEYLEQEVYSEHRESVAFLNPDVAQLLKVNSTDDKCICEPLNLAQKTAIFIPVNDSTSSDSFGGSHWSLLVLNKKVNSFLYYDSCDGMGNYAHAQLIGQRLSNVLGEQYTIKKMECPVQTNGYDCGIYVLKNVDFLCRTWISENNYKVTTVKENYDTSDARTAIKNIIYELANKSQ